MSYACRVAAVIGCLGRLVVFPAVALAAGPVALVESVTGTSDIEWMDYVYTGKTVALRPNGQLIIDYLSSCVRETITGGTVTIGADRSAVAGGHVERERVRCNGGQLQLSAEQSQVNAGTVSRVSPKAHPLPPGTIIQRRLYGVSPIFDLAGETSLKIERLDSQESPLVILVTPDQLIHGRFYDFAANHSALSSGGVYRATIDQHSVVFQIDRSAKPGMTPLTGRLISF